MTQQNSISSDWVKSGTVFSRTEIADAIVRKRFPNAYFVPCCALGCYYGVYSDETLNEHVADYRYLEKGDVIPDSVPPTKAFGSYFKLIWKR